MIKSGEKKPCKNPESVYRAKKRKRNYTGFVGFSICFGCGSFLMYRFIFLRHIWMYGCVFTDIQTPLQQVMKKVEKLGCGRRVKKCIHTG